MNEKQQDFLLKRSGMRPLRFIGTPLVKTGAPASKAPMWHEVSIYETNDDCFVVQIHVHSDAQGTPDIHRAELFETVEGVADYLQHYNPRSDVPGQLPLCDGITSTGDLQKQAAALSEQLDQVTKSYQSMITSILPRSADTQPG